jgi:hypothetical protein
VVGGVVAGGVVAGGVVGRGVVAGGGRLITTVGGGVSWAGVASTGACVERPVGLRNCPGALHQLGTSGHGNC